MGMEGVSDSRRQVIITRGRAHARDVKIGLLWVRTEFAQDSLDAFLRFLGMDELWFQLGKDLCETLHRQMELSGLRVKGMKGLLRHLAREIHELE